MRLLKYVAAFAGWAALSGAIPTALLYPAVFWIAGHKNLSVDALGRMYALLVALLFLPTAFLVELFYRRLIRNGQRRRTSAKRSSSHCIDSRIS